MNDSPILNIDPIADFYKIDIAAYDCIEPYAAIIPHTHLSDYNRIICQEYIITETWRLAADCFDDRHNKR
jgi:hypothetical protein